MGLTSYLCTKEINDIIQDPFVSSQGWFKNKLPVKTTTKKEKKLEPKQKNYIPHKDVKINEKKIMREE